MSIQEFKVATRSDLSPGEMQQLQAGETEILLARDKDDFFATAAYCTHYGAPLAEGALSGKRVVCPWHHACFDVSNGDQVEPPGCDSLPSFEVEVRGEDVFVKVPEDAPTMRMADMKKRDKTDDQLYVIVGGGTAGQYAAEALRAENYQGRILMISQDKHYPYDRVNCSKEYLQGEAPEEWMPLRDAGFYEEHDIEIMIEASVSKLDTKQKKIHIQNGDVIHYDKVLVCTGAAARNLTMQGAELENVFTLRSLHDSSHIQVAAKKAKRAVVVGSSFIGMEGAWSLSKLGCEVTVVSPEKVPFASKWGEEVGNMLKKKHEENGIKFCLETKVSSLKGNGKVERVKLENGDTIETDLVLVGIGVDPVTHFIEGLELADDGGIEVDDKLQAGNDIYAAGDVAHFPYKNTKARIEHWRLACQHGRLAGKNMAGNQLAYESVPSFWTAQQGLQIRYIGYTTNYDRIVVDGSISEQEFITYYVQDGLVKAALGINRDKEMAALLELIRLDRVPPVKDLEKHQIDLVQHLQQANESI